MPSTKPTGKLTHIKDLVPDPSNRRRRTPRGHGMIVDSLQAVGAARSIVIDEGAVILAGNGVIEGAAEVGITKLKVVDAEGDEIVAVRRRGLTEEQKRHLAMYDNRTAELAEWDDEQIRFDVDAGMDLSPWFEDVELAKVIASTETKDGLTDPDAEVAKRATTIQRGDLFELGKHRILCGDAEQKADVARLIGRGDPLLMVTDPPYGVNYNPRWRLEAGVNKPHQKRAESAPTNDHRSDWRLAWDLFPGWIAYVWHGGLHSSIFEDGLKAARFLIRSQIIWSKPSLVIGRGHYHWQHEPCWYAVRKGATGHWIGDRKQSTVWEIANMHRTQGKVDDGKNDHATQKPVECMLRPMRNHASPEVYDPFVGSGTTIIAAEQIGRACLAMDIDPQFVQMALDRWEAFTGQTAVKVGEAVAV